MQNLTWTSLFSDGCIKLTRRNENLYLISRYIRPYFTDLRNDHFSQVIRKISQTRSSADFIALKEMKDEDKSHKNSPLKTVRSEDIMLEAVNLN